MDEIYSCPAGSFCLNSICEFSRMEPTCKICDRCTSPNGIACVTSTSYVNCVNSLLQSDERHCPPGQICDPAGTPDSPCAELPIIGEKLLCYKRIFIPPTGSSSSPESTTESLEAESTNEEATTDSAEQPSSTLSMSSSSTESAEQPTSTLSSSVSSTTESAVQPTSTFSTVSSTDITSTEESSPTPRNVQEYLRQLCAAPRFQPSQNISYPPDRTCST